MFKHWLHITLILCTYGFFREFRPSEPFVSEFLSGHWREISADQVTQLVYPIGTYSFLVLLVVAFLVTDILRYKPLIWVSACTGISVYSVMLWTTSLEALQASQVLYGLYMATEVAYYTYIYAKVDRERFQMVTGFTKAAILGGRFMAGATGQLLVSFRLMDLRELNYITLVAQGISLLFALFLPAVVTSVYFHSNSAKPISPNESKDVEVPNLQLESKTANNPLNTSARCKDFSFRKAIILLWSHFIDSYSDPIVIQWSIWWALTMCGFYQVQTYVQFLWQDIFPNQDVIYNGAVEAALTLCGAAGAFAAGFINNDRFDRWSFWVLSLVSLVMGGILLGGTLTTYIWVSYGAYVLFGTATHFMVTIASINVAKRLKDDTFGLVFGINTLLALIGQTVLTVIVISNEGFALGPRDQFKVNSGYFAVLGVWYAITGVIQLIYKRRSPSNVD